MSIHADFEPVATNYAKLGFHLTDITYHPTGTGNRLIIFGSNFFELIVVTHREKLAERSRAMVDDFLVHRSGLSGIAMLSRDQKADVAAFEAAGVPVLMTHAFQRPITLPDGRPGMADVEVVFTKDLETPLVFFFTSRQKRPEAIWQPVWQNHPNGAVDILEVVSVEVPGQDKLARYQAGILGADNVTSDGGVTTGRVANGYALTINTPAVLEARFAWAGLACEPHPAYAAGLVIKCGNLDFVRKAVAEHAIPATCRAHDIFIDPAWTGGTFLHLVGDSAP
ncbi:MAG: VOC family protein [Hyphomicrobiales bacterium]|nr:VOC family protein [Hyphomicrobiales bacterium]